MLSYIGFADRQMRRASCGPRRQALVTLGLLTLPFLTKAALFAAARADEPAWFAGFMCWTPT